MLECSAASPIYPSPNPYTVTREHQLDVSVHVYVPYLWSMEAHMADAQLGRARMFDNSFSVGPYDPMTILFLCNMNRALQNTNFPAFLYQIGGHKIPTNFHVGRHRSHKPK
jgi:hypothetical protein